MKIVTWNVNSLKVRLPHLLDLLVDQQPDVVCLQETKLEDINFPVEILKEAGFCAAFSGQKTYNGVALLSRTPIGDVQTGLPGFSDEQRRLIAGTVGGVRVVSVYVPNGQALDSEKYAYKLEWLKALRRWLALEAQHCPEMVVGGDYNIAPTARDVHDPDAWAGQILCSEPERVAFQGLLDLGFKDGFRLFEQAGQQFSWWDYRMLGFQKNHGLRIDHLLVSDSLVPLCTGAGIDRGTRKKARPSDHAPVWIEIEREVR